MVELSGIEQERFQTTRKVTLVGAVINLVLAAGKILFGFVAQSQALIADGIHSLSDLFSDALVYYAASHARHGPDSDHPGTWSSACAGRGGHRLGCGGAVVHP